MDSEGAKRNAMQDASGQKRLGASTPRYLNREEKELSGLFGTCF